MTATLPAHFPYHTTHTKKLQRFPLSRQRSGWFIVKEETHANVNIAAVVVVVLGAGGGNKRCPKQRVTLYISKCYNNKVVTH